MNKKTIISTLALVTIFSIGIVNTSPIIEAKASTIEIKKDTHTKIDIEKIKEILTEQGVNEETQEKLINKKLNGELWDVENPEKLKEVPDEFYILDFNNPSEKKVYTFEDGSILELSHSPKFPTPREIISNSYTTTWKEEQVKATYGVMRATIYVNCEWTKGIGAKIRDFTDSNIYVWNVGGSVLTTNMQINSSTSAIGKISVTNSSYFGKHSDFRAEFKVLSSHGTVSFKLVKM